MATAFMELLYNNVSPSVAHGIPTSESQRYLDCTPDFKLKTGSGCYWDSALNGGTVLKVNKNGVYEVYHEYVKAIVE